MFVYGPRAWLNTKMLLHDDSKLEIVKKLYACICLLCELFKNLNAGAQAHGKGGFVCYIDKTEPPIFESELASTNTSDEHSCGDRKRTNTNNARRLWNRCKCLHGTKETHTMQPLFGSVFLWLQKRTHNATYTPYNKLSLYDGVLMSILSIIEL